MCRAVKLHLHDVGFDGATVASRHHSSRNCCGIRGHENLKRASRCHVKTIHVKSYSIEAQVTSEDDNSANAVAVTRPGTTRSEKSRSVGIESLLPPYDRLESQRIRTFARRGWALGFSQRCGRHISCSESIRRRSYFSIVSRFAPVESLYCHVHYARQLRC